MKLFNRVIKATIVSTVSLALVACIPNAHASHPNLVITEHDVANMRVAIDEPGRFRDAYQTFKLNVDEQLTLPMVVPVPADGGGGYTHEQHKKNYQAMYNAGVVFQLSQDEKYAHFVRDMLLEYAELYPTIGLHPKRKVKSQNPGKLFWQSLNEAMWLVYTIQAYDLVVDSIGENARNTIESVLLKPVAQFLSEGQPSTFNKVHNHGTWATAGVGMAGYVLDEPERVEQALLDLNKSGKGGFLRQLDELFSPQGYYNEGPYYQRFALLPFVTFAKAIENNEPDRKIFEHRDGIILKAVDTTIQLSYNTLFFPINDAIKSKGIDTIELVNGVTVAYGLTQSPGFLDIAQQQKQVVLTGDGLKVANALDDGLAEPYNFVSQAFGDGSQGDQGALVVMRSELPHEQALLFKPAAQGLGHGHFDKLTWQFYDKGNEIVSDYGAARFLNVEAKFGGRYLPENETYAKQTVAHNTVVVDETSHFEGKTSVGNRYHPTLDWFEAGPNGTAASAHISTAYDDVTLSRTLALVELDALATTIAVDLFSVVSSTEHQFDLPLHYHGQLIDTNFAIQSYTEQLSALGKNNGYQHLWHKGSSTPEKGLARVTWLNDNGRFYSQTSLVSGEETFLFTQIGANDPNFNLRNEQGFIRRVSGEKSHTFVSVLEPHGDYNPSKEYTLDAISSIQNLQVVSDSGTTFIELSISGLKYLIVLRDKKATKQATVSYLEQSYPLEGHYGVFLLSDTQE